jgi:hypothetical protein
MGQIRKCPFCKGVMGSSLLLTHVKARSISSMRILGTAYSSGSQSTPLIPCDTVHLPVVTFEVPGTWSQ